VRLPFQGESTHSEEGSLLRFLNAHDLREISINDEAVPLHFSSPGAGYVRFLHLAVESPPFTIYLRRLSLSMPFTTVKSDGENLLLSILNILSTLSSPLEDFSLSGRPLKVDEVSRLACVLPRWACTLHHLQLIIATFLPSTFDLLSRTLPSLHTLNVTFEAISADEQCMVDARMDGISVRVFCGAVT
jgi:hypothetical protein